MTAPKSFDDSLAVLLTVTDVRVTLQPDALVVAFAVEDGDDVRVHAIKWHARDAFQVRDLARQLVTLAEGMRGAESLCLCDLYHPPCPVHAPLFKGTPKPEAPVRVIGNAAAPTLGNPAEPEGR